MESFDVGCLLPIIEKRAITCIVIGGGSPCQGNSLCNNNRGNLEDERSWQPQWLARFADEVRQLEPVVRKKIPVTAWLENVGSAQTDVLKCYNNLLNASRIRLRASEFGYTHRDRCFWGNVDGKPLGVRHWTVPDCF